ncbi:hypothetical protein CTAYLR_008132 [Chrysophaeum taylorii]|uniref:Uncharacterized protein n=1 Tax=Chrysophaeum taylorii TaxID=2483200 RepID=A0AAD7UL88_9STRA|nr:hypothetical protein CTAYLR_008132 [Chrysophaeum taylorii]
MRWWWCVAVVGACLSLSPCVSIVTGGSRGIGKGIALELGKAGATVYVVGRSSRGRQSVERSLPAGEDLTVEATAEAVTAAGGVGVAVALDATDDRALAQLAERVREEAGRLDVVACSAYSTPPSLEGPGFRDAFWRQGAAMWDACHGVGLRSAYVLCCEAAPLMVETAASGGRPIVAIVSSFGGQSYTFNVAYGVGKAATDRLVKDMAIQLAPVGIDAVSLYPGIVRTEGNLELDRRGEWADASGGLDLESGETPGFTGRALVKLLEQPPEIRRARSGTVQVVAELARELDFEDDGGRRPPSIRSLRFLVPNFVLTDAKLRTFPPSIAPFLKAARDRLVPDVLLPWSVFSGGPPPPPSSSSS